MQYSFLFDGVDIFEYFAKRGITFKTNCFSVSKDNIRIFKNDKELAQAQTARKRNGDKSITVKTREDDMELLFVILFSLSKIYI